MRSSSSHNRRVGPTLKLIAGPAAVVAVAIAIGLLVWAPHSQPRAPLRTALVLTVQKDQATGKQLAIGETLFDENCASCHGNFAQGSKLAPNLEGLGSATVDLWVSSGWMPLANPTAEPIRKPALFSPQQSRDIAYYVASLSAGGPSIPHVNLSGASVSTGFSLFALNCAPCHTITGAGDALSNGLSAPPLHGVTALQVAEALETGPGNMPRLIGNFTPQQVNDIIAYVTKDIEHPTNPGGIGLGGVGPVAEGFIGLFVGVGLCVLIALWIGDRTEADDESGHGHHEVQGAGSDA